ncbi:MAG: hypothetical protein VW270_14400, partial [Candidatus Poseidoniales archaeon]
GVPFGNEQETYETIRCQRDWHTFLRRLRPTWIQYTKCASSFQTSFCSPFNPWFKDYPVQWLLPLIELLKTARYEEKDHPQLRIPGAVRHWDGKNLGKLQTDIPYEDAHSDIGPNLMPEEPQFGIDIATKWALHIHGFAKTSMLILGLEHHHDGDDLLLTHGWEALLEGLGFT